MMYLKHDLLKLTTVYVPIVTVTLVVSCTNIFTEYSLTACYRQCVQHSSYTMGASFVVNEREILLAIFSCSQAVLHSIGGETSLH